MNIKSTLAKFMNEKSILFFVFAFIFISGIQQNFSPDFGFHLKSAQWMLENGKFIYTDSFSYTSSGNNYYNLQWLYQLMQYSIYKVSGDTGNIVFNTVLICCAFFIALLKHRKSNPSYSGFGAVLLVAVLGLNFEIRPHVVSWIYLALTIYILEEYKQTKTKRIFWLPIIIMMWVNTHSLAVLGLVVICIYNVGIYFETKQFDKSLLRFSLFSLIAFSINPYLFKSYGFVLDQFGIIAGGSVQKNFMGEIQSPFVLTELKTQGLKYLINPLFYMQLLGLVALLSAFISFKKRNFCDALLVVVFFYLFNSALKNYGYFVVATLPITVKNLSSFSVKSKNSKLFNPINLRLLLFTVLIIISLTTITNAFGIARKSPYKFGIGIDKNALPVDAVKFLKTNNIKGKMLNHIDFGGYLMYHYDEKVFIDGRIEIPNQNFLKKYFASRSAEGFENLLNEYNPAIIIFPYLSATGWWINLMKNANYRPVYFDQLAIIYLRKDVGENLKSINESYFTQLNHQLSDSEAEQKLSLIFNKKYDGFVEGLYKPQYYPLTELNLSTYCFTAGYSSAGLYYSIEGINKSTVNPKELFYNLGLYFKDKNFLLATKCFKMSK